MTNTERAEAVYTALEALEFDLDKDGFIATIARSLDQTGSSLESAAPALLKALEMADAASTVYDSDGLTPLQDEIRKVAKAAGEAPSQYVKNAIRAAIAAAKGQS